MTACLLELSSTNPCTHACAGSCAGQAADNPVHIVARQLVCFSLVSLLHTVLLLQASAEPAFILLPLEVMEGEHRLWSQSRCAVDHSEHLPNFSFVNSLGLFTHLQAPSVH